MRLEGETVACGDGVGEGGPRRRWEKVALAYFFEHPNNGFSGFLPEPVDKRKEWISPYGVYGMGHNVWEWVSDGYTYPGQPEGERGKFKVVRGGLTQTHLSVKFTPTYTRNWMEPGARYNFLGFRCARDAVGDGEKKIRDDLRKRAAPVTSRPEDAG